MATENALRLEVITPERTLFSQDVVSVVIPGALGDFSALPGHAPFVSLLRPGVITVLGPLSGGTKIFVSGGFAEVSQKTCVILAAQAVPVDQLDRSKLQQQIQEFQEDLKLEKQSVQQAFYEHEILVIQAKIDAVQQNVYTG